MDKREQELRDWRDQIARILGGDYGHYREEHLKTAEKIIALRPKYKPAVIPENPYHSTFEHYEFYHYEKALADILSANKGGLFTVKEK